MNQELEALIKAYDAFREARERTVAKQRRAIFDSRLEDHLAQHPGVSKTRLENVIKFAHRHWLKAQRRPASIPPKA